MILYRDFTMKGCLSKLTVAMALLLGNVINNKTLENDSQYMKNSVTLHHGWNWGINSDEAEFSNKWRVTDDPLPSCHPGKQCRNPNDIGDPKFIAPILFDLDKKGYQINDPAVSGIAYKRFDEEQYHGMAWPSANNQLLVMDSNLDGVVNGLSEIAFSRLTGKEGSSDAEGLATLDLNKDGAIDGNDPAYKTLYLWRDENQNGVSEPGELISLSSLNMIIYTQLTVNMRMAGESVIYGNINYQYFNGDKTITGQAADVFLKVKN